MQSRQLRLALFSATLFMTANYSYSAGYLLNEHSASCIGQAHAGMAAFAPDASVLSENPAAMTLMKRAQFTGSLIYLKPDIYLEREGRKLDGAKQIIDEGILPGFFYVTPGDDTNWRYGIGLFTNFDMGTNYSQSSGITGLAKESSLKTVTINPSLAYKINNSLSIGAGITVTGGKLVLSSIADKTIALKIGNQSLQEFITRGQELLKVDGDDVAFSWNVGALWQATKKLRIGISYRPEFKMRFQAKSSSEVMNGDKILDLADINIRIPIVGRIISNEINREIKNLEDDIPANKPQWNSHTTVEMPMPELFDISLFYQLNQELALHASAVRTGWSSFNKVVIDLPYAPVVQEQWHDVWRLSFGASWQVYNSLTLRGGISYDQSPVRNSYRNFRLPDGNRQIYTAGFTWELNQSHSVDVGYMYVTGKKVHVNDKLEIPVGVIIPIERASADVKGQAQLFGMQYNYTF